MIDSYTFPALEQLSFRGRWPCFHIQKEVPSFYPRPSVADTYWTETPRVRPTASVGRELLQSWVAHFIIKVIVIIQSYSEPSFLSCCVARYTLKKGGNCIVWRKLTLNSGIYVICYLCFDTL